jgi:hypothetical protein
MTIASESKENMALSLGRSMLHFNRFDSLEESAERINSITPEKLQQIALEVFSTEQLSQLVYVE